MIFTGFSVGALLGVFAAVGLATVALYILKLRRRPVAVPFSMPQSSFMLIPVRRESSSMVIPADSRT